jgi:hypothetical protein
VRHSLATQRARGAAGARSGARSGSSATPHRCLRSPEDTAEAAEGTFGAQRTSSVRQSSSSLPSSAQSSFSTCARACTGARGVASARESGGRRRRHKPSRPRSGAPRPK